MRIGEFVRAYFLGEKHNISKASVFVTIFVERILDAIVLIGFLMILMALNIQAVVEGLAKEYITWGLGILISLFVVLFVMMVYSARNPVLIRTTINFIALIAPGRFRSQLLNFSGFVESGLSSIQNPKSLLLLLVASLPVWISEIMVFTIIGYSMGFLNYYGNNYFLLLEGMTLVTSLSNLISSVPSAPGGIGIFELTVREVLLLDTGNLVDRSTGAAFALIVHGILIIPVTLVGQLLLWSNNLSLRKLIASKKQSDL